MPSKSLMKKFTKVVLPKNATRSESVYSLYYVDDKPVRMDDLATVIDLARGWCNKAGSIGFGLEYCSANKDWHWHVRVWDVECITCASVLNKCLASAIMQAVCEASKGMGVLTTDSAHSRALKKAFHTYAHEATCRAYITALLDDAEVQEEIAEVLTMADNEDGYYTKEVIDTLKRIVGE